MNGKHKQIFKTGLIVADVEAAMRDLDRWLSLDWTPLRTVDLEVRTPLGQEAVSLSFVCARRGDNVLELIEAQPEGYYRLPTEAPLHHVGMWVDDLPATSASLVADGMPLEAAGVNAGQSPALFAFHTNPYGLRVELVDTVMRPMFESWLAGGDLGL